MVNIVIDVKMAIMVIHRVAVRIIVYQILLHRLYLLQNKTHLKVFFFFHVLSHHLQIVIVISKER